MNKKEFRVVLGFEDGSKSSVIVTADSTVDICQIARGWLMASALGVSVRYYQIDENGRCMGTGGEYVR